MVSGGLAFALLATLWSCGSDRPECTIDSECDGQDVCADSVCGSAPAACQAMCNQMDACGIEDAAACIKDNCGQSFLGFYGDEYGADCADAWLDVHGCLANQPCEALMDVDTATTCAAEYAVRPERCGGTGTGTATGTDMLPPSCAESGVFCQDNVLYDCSTLSEVIDCDACTYVGPGTGSEYDTSCKAQASDCGVCGPDGPWSGPGCYFGDGPAVCD